MNTEDSDGSFTNILGTSELCDFKAFRQATGLEGTNIEIARHYTKHWQTLPPLVQNFDPNLYLNENPDISNIGICPLAHFLAEGINEARNFNTKISAETISVIENCRLIDLHHIAKENQLSLSNRELALYYILNWRSLKSASKYFDTDYYLKTYEDVNKAEICPLAHYLQQGYKEGRWPNQYFDPKFYVKTYPHVSQAKVEPLTHYIEVGWREKYTPHAKFDVEVFSTIESFYRNNCPLDFLLDRRPSSDLYQSSPTKLNSRNQNRQEYQHWNGTVDIIIPIYNSPNELRTLISSLYRENHFDFRLILVDDASTNTEITPLLESLAKKHPNVVVLKNEKNIGFPGTVNKGYKHVSSEIFVILNTDTEVPKSWLPRLIAPFSIDERICSATPFSNSATICSFPTPNTNNPTPTSEELEIVDSIFSSTNSTGDYQDIPTGVGFCLALRKDVVDEIGFFDESAFELGYGEEVDWCLRAYLKGYRNVLVHNLYVAHKGGASFSEDHRQLGLIRSRNILATRYPFYDQWIAGYIEQDPLRHIRNRVLANIIAATGNATLIIDHSATGGTNLYSDKLAQELFQRSVPYVKMGATLKGSIGYGVAVYKNQAFALETEYDNLEEFLHAFNFKKIVINSLVFNKHFESIINSIASYKSKQDQIIVEYLLHDYYAICPSYILVNKDDVFCGLPPINTCRTCSIINPNNGYNLSPNDVLIDRWRNIWEKLLDCSTTIKCFSNASRLLLEKIYPETSKKNLIEPHKVDGFKEISYTQPKKQGKINLAFVGGLSKHKGSSIAIEISNEIIQRNLPIQTHVIGTIYDPESKFQGEISGPYVREELINLLSSRRIDIVFLPFVWPETFSYLTQELMDMNVHIGTFNIGAPGERISSYKNGFVIDEISAVAALDGIIKYINHI